VTVALLVLAVAQIVAGAVVLRRLARGRERPAPLAGTEPAAAGVISVLIPARDEEHRIGPLLEAVAAFGPAVAEILVVDDRSADGTADLVAAAAERDPRIRCLPGREPTEGWVGKQHALQQALAEATAPWCLCLDADTVPEPTLPDSLLRALDDGDLDAISAAPRFAVDTVGESLLHPALLATLVYRFGPPTDEPPHDERVVANGQCLLLPTERLWAAGGWEPVRANMTEDVALIRHLIRADWRVGMRDASRLLVVDMHSSGREAWREWGRSLALPGVASGREQLTDIVTLALTLVAPPVIVIAALWGSRWWLLVPALILLAVRWLFHVALRATYDHPRWTFWVAPFADPLAVVRLVASAVRPNRRWRGRDYARSG